MTIDDVSACAGACESWIAAIAVVVSRMSRMFFMSPLGCEESKAAVKLSPVATK
ncbi:MULTISPECIES: hypothetical protein [unclassified Afipia]|jgi:hypothetical protein|uniref:hypothetical protein n=1 Tax=unclassified Afipia TaxID=2642050 RepID=UPI001FCBBFFE|nr:MULTISPECIES: hypothetical protein [unclassified Afipia]